MQYKNSEISKTEKKNEQTRRVNNTHREKLALYSVLLKIY